MKEKIARSFYPQTEKPVDFLGVHPLKAGIAQIAASPTLAKIEAFLDRNERERVVALGGLHILATERHEARRIDNQLRGRAGRQGDPGSSRFYLSLEDDLMRIFGSDRISGLMLRLGMEEGVPIEHRMVTNSIERAQKQVEAQNFAVRKHLLEYDDVMNKQRTAVYDMRRMVLEGKNTREHVLSLSREVLDWYLDSYCEESADPSSWNLTSLQSALRETYGLDVQLVELQSLGRAEMAEVLARRIEARYDEKEAAVGAELMLFHQRMLMLQIVDTQWKDHLYGLDHLKEGIGLRGLRPARPPRRVQERVVQHVPGPHGPDRRGDPALDLPLSAGRGTPGGRSRRWARKDRRPFESHAPEGLQAGPPPRARLGEGPSLAFGGRGAPPAQPHVQRSDRGALGLQAGRAQGGPGRRGRGRHRASRGEEGGPQRSLSVRQRSQVQEMPRRQLVTEPEPEGPRNA